MAAPCSTGIPSRAKPTLSSARSLDYETGMGGGFDVGIAGYGPVGQLLAILLAQRGWKVGVFEKQPQPYPLPRAVHFDHEVGRILQAAGVADALAGMTEPTEAYDWRNAAGKTLLRLGGKQDGVSGWPQSSMFSQPDLEHVLDLRARSLPNVEMHRGSEVVDLRQQVGGVETTLAGADGRRWTEQCRWIVGCDGANSSVRPLLDATVTDLGFNFDWLIVDVVPRENRWKGLNWQLCDPARPTTIVSGGPGRRRWEFMRLPHETIDELNSEATAWRLLEPWGLSPANCTLERHAVYTFRARWADRWRAGRLLIAGDAAHLMPPFAGQGMCSGMRDAANLAWKLDLVLGGKSPEALLDTYTSERLPNVTAVINHSIDLGRLICITDLGEAAARDASAVAIKPPPSRLGPGFLVAGDPHAGQLFLQGRIGFGGSEGLFDDVVGRGWALVSPSFDPTSELDADEAAFFASIGGLSAQIGANSPFHDVEGRYGKWFGSRGLVVVLQRPDFYVFGAATDVQGTGRLVRQLRRALARGIHAEPPHSEPSLQ